MGAAFGGRWAAIDIGTNSVRLLVAEVRGDTVVAVRRALRLTRLGQGVDRERRLAPEAAARTVAAVAELAQQARDMQAKDIVIAGTSALRDARDRADFCREVERTTGLPVYILSGPGEAALSFMGAVRGLASVAGDGEGTGPAREVWVVDVGGGSTEVVRGTAQGQVVARASADVGAVRMTEAAVRSDPVSAEDWCHLTAAIEQGLAPLWQALLGDGQAEGVPAPVGGLFVGVGGTVTTLAAMDQQLDPYDPDKVHGYRLSRSAVAGMLERMRAATVAERRTWPGLQPQRADIILSGTAIVLAVMTRLGADSLLVSEADLLDGLILWAARLGRDPAYLVDGR
ncbi:MAG: phosphatase [Bacillota bacterium]|nr:MAG: phosphatase [Bacillota bacterium]